MKGLDGSSPSFGNWSNRLSPFLCRIRGILSRQDGIALLMVLVVVTLLTTMVVSFTDTTQKHLKVTQHYKDRLQAYWAAQSGLQAAAGLLIMDAQARRGHDGADSPWNCESALYHETVTLLLANVFCGSSMLEPSLLLTETDPVEGETTLARCPRAVPIMDENRKLSLHSLVDNISSNQERTNEDTFKRLSYLLQFLVEEQDLLPPEERGDLSELELSPGTGTEKITLNRADELAGYLVDWMDTGNNTTPEPELNRDVAESSCPEDGLPYEAKNGLLDSIDEIGLACGFRQMPRSTIQRLTRHMTAYPLDTNINTASFPVLHAFCARELDDPGEIVSREIYEALHPVADQDAIDVIQDKKSVATFLGDRGVDQTLARRLEDSMGVQSTHFRIGIYGVVYDTETGTERARSRLQMDLQRAQGQTQGRTLALLYYRED
jgi:type II secretory pathway component PulK